jgi:hypothetical protein
LPSGTWCTERAKQYGLDWPVRRRNFLLGLGWLTAWSGSGTDAASNQPDRPPVIAIAAFDYVDTSGEPVDQHDQHQRLLFRFEQQLIDGLANGSYQPVHLKCSAPVCSSGALTPAELIVSAKNSGADLLVFGGVHKMSTLVQWILVEVADVSAKKLLLKRLLTFRGDTDIAWDHAARYVANLLNATIGWQRPK